MPQKLGYTADTRIKVSQGTIDKIASMGQKAAEELVRSGKASPEFKEGVQRYYHKSGRNIRSDDKYKAHKAANHPAKLPVGAAKRKLGIAVPVSSSKAKGKKPAMTKPGKPPTVMGIKINPNSIAAKLMSGEKKKSDYRDKARQDFQGVLKHLKGTARTTSGGGINLPGTR